MGINISQIIPPDKKKEEMECTKQIASGRICESYETQRVTKSGQILVYGLLLHVSKTIMESSILSQRQSEILPISRMN